MTALQDVRDWALRLSPTGAATVPATHPARLPIFALTDVPFMLGMGLGRWLRCLRWFRTLQRNLTLDHWTSLSEIYPRHMLLLYFYLLFMWARFCGVLEQVLAGPDASVVAELFIRYNCELDQQVDRPDGPARLLTEPLFARRAARAQSLAAEFWAVLHAARRPRAAERAIVRLFQDYRQSFLSILGRTARQGAGLGPLPQVFEDKARVAGDLWAVWGRILGLIYGVPQDRAEAGAEMLHAFGMITQIADDMWDLPEDRANAQPNLFDTLASLNAIERDRLDAYLEPRREPYLNIRWVKAQLPETYERAARLIADYLAVIERLDERGSMMDDARQCAALLIKP